ncbi:MAG: alpha/beta fold hydrolase [Zetaproteobacteria bacterium]|nr:MAG: alpha/beta fold hydrolase [Zetaproteobacteria bacterium]
MAERPTAVLIHGLFGFNRFLGMEYFHGARALLEGIGLRVLTPRLPWAGDIMERAQALAGQLANEPGPLHLIGHSMGGLDARAYISHLQGASRVASLTTLASPHRGSSAADHVCATLSPFALFRGVRALTRERVQAFNEITPDAPGVCYRSYAASRPLSELPWLTRRYARVIAQHEGENDSQVSLASACWGEHVATLHADHFELIGMQLWLNPWRRRARFDHLQLFREIGQWILAHAGANRSLQQ